jgi:AcrR family transcriptional regulator
MFFLRLSSARQLFAERDIASVGIREIASAAGVRHGLVQRYCGTREQMIAEIVRQEIEGFSAVVPRAPARAARRPSSRAHGILNQMARSGMTSS